jgi:hypothetical protein
MKVKQSAVLISLMVLLVGWSFGDKTGLGVAAVFLILINLFG